MSKDTTGNAGSETQKAGIWKLDDCDYVAALTREEAIIWYEGQTGVHVDEIEESSPLLMIADNDPDDGDRVRRRITMLTVIGEHLEAGGTLPFIVGTDAHYA